MEKVIKKFPEGFYWVSQSGRLAQDPFVQKFEFTKNFSQKVYSLCKREILIFL
jgi:hypothetical protein